MFGHHQREKLLLPFRMQLFQSPTHQLQQKALYQVHWLFLAANTKEFQNCFLLLWLHSIFLRSQNQWSLYKMSSINLTFILVRLFSYSKRMFWGLMSLWMIWTLWQKLIDLHTCWSTTLTSSSLNLWPSWLIKWL